MTDSQLFPADPDEPRKLDLGEAISFVANEPNWIIELRLNTPSFSYGDVEAGGVYG